MLKVLRLNNLYAKDVRSEDLFADNPTFALIVEAPLYWWVDIDWPKYFFNMPLNDFQFCFDEFTGGEINRFAKVLGEISLLSPRQIMSLLPLSTMVVGHINLTYREIIDVCENYLSGEYVYQSGYSFPNEREWKDFCETLLDIKGIRDIVKEED